MKSKPMMFSGNRPLKEIKKAVLKAGGEWNQDRYDNGSDWLSFTYKSREVVYSGFNGRFMVKAGKKIVTESSTEMEKHKWYVELLALLYLPLAEAA